MAKRTNKPETVQVFVVSWFPVNTKEAMTIRCLSRTSANSIVSDLQASFAKYPDHDPLIHIDRSEEKVNCSPEMPGVSNKRISDMQITLAVMLQQGREGLVNNMIWRSELAALLIEVARARAARITHLRDTKTMARYILIDNCSGYIFGDSADGRIFNGSPLACVAALDASIGSYGRSYEEVSRRSLGSNEAGYHIYRADVGGSEAVPVVQDGQDRETIEAVERDCEYVTTIRITDQAE